MPKNEKCAVTDTALCKWLDKECEACYINTLRNDEDKEEALKNFEVMLSLLPDEFDELCGEECQFCIKDPRKRSGYAITDLGHAEPKTMRGMIFGLGKKIQRRIGSMVPVNISICADCRRVFRMTEAVKWLCILIFTALSVLVISFPGIMDTLGGTESALTYVIVIGAALLGYFAGKLIEEQYKKAKSKKTRLNIFEIPVCAKMKENGWFLVMESPYVTRFIFSKKPVLHKIKDIRKLKHFDEKDFEQTTFLED